MASTSRYSARTCCRAGGCRRRPVHLCRPVRPALRGEHRAANGARVGERASSTCVHDPVRRRCARRAPKPAPGRRSPPRHRRYRCQSLPRRPSSGSRTRCRVGGIVGCGNVVTRAARSKRPLSLLVWSSVVAPVPLLGLSLVFEGTGRWQTAMSSVGTSGIVALAYVVVVSTFFGYGVWYWLISRYPASTVAPFTLLVPVVGILTAWLVRGSIRRGASCWGLSSSWSALDSHSGSATRSRFLGGPPPACRRRHRHPGTVAPTIRFPTNQEQTGRCVYAELRHQI
jgi:EamA-like transporter family